MSRSIESLLTDRTILVLAANPANETRLRLDQEVREIDEGLRRSRNRDRFRLEQRWAVRTEDLRRSLLDVEPQIVHFCGHGVGKEGLIFEDKAGQSKLVSTEALADFFELFAGKIECVVLNACYSEVQADAIAYHIDYVIGMNQAIGDGAAIQFTTGFYDALGAGRSVEEAYRFGCSAIQLEGILRHLTPVLRKLKLKMPEKRVIWKLVLTATLQDLKGKKVEETVELLREITGDVSITLKPIAEGSVILTLESFEESFNHIKFLFNSEQLTVLLKLLVKEIILITEQEMASKQLYQSKTVVELKGKVSFGIVTFKEEEFNALVQRFQPWERVDGRHSYIYSRLRSVNEQEYSIIIIRCLEQGQVAAQQTTNDLIEDLNPQWLLLVGIAGGIPAEEYTLGDVLLASRLHDFSVSAAVEGQETEFNVAGGPVHREIAKLLGVIPAYRNQPD
jgi:CHAT domain